MARQYNPWDDDEWNLNDDNDINKPASTELFNWDIRTKSGYHSTFPGFHQSNGDQIPKPRVLLKRPSQPQESTSNKNEAIVNDKENQEEETRIKQELKDKELKYKLAREKIFGSEDQVESQVHDHIKHQTKHHSNPNRSRGHAHRPQRLNKGARANK